MHRYSMLCAAAVLAAWTMPAPAGAADLAVTIAGLTSPDGTVFAALHDGADGFPDEREPVAVASAPAVEGSVTLVFGDLAPGLYAIAAFQDEDGDGELSRNLFGIPGEPFGFSRDARGSFGPPSFGDAAFETGPGSAGITLTLGD